MHISFRSCLAANQAANQSSRRLAPSKKQAPVSCGDPASTRGVYIIRVSAPSSPALRTNSYLVCSVWHSHYTAYHMRYFILEISEAYAPCVIREHLPGFGRHKSSNRGGGGGDRVSEFPTTDTNLRTPRDKEVPTRTYQVRQKHKLVTGPSTYSSGTAAVQEH